MLEAMRGAGIEPIVYAFAEGQERFSYLAEKINPATREFVESRRGDPRDRPVKNAEELMQGDIFYLTCIDLPERLAPFNAMYRNEFHCVYGRDIYSGEQWLEIMPAEATKARAARRLAARLGCARIVAFGDAVNDLDLFREADEAYAVANAAPELKAEATAVIGGNDEDGVAHWLSEHVMPEIS